MATYDLNDLLLDYTMDPEFATFIPDLDAEKYHTGNYKYNECIGTPCAFADWVTENIDGMTCEEAVLGVRDQNIEWSFFIRKNGTTILSDNLKDLICIKIAEDSNLALLAHNTFKNLTEKEKEVYAESAKKLGDVKLKHWGKK